MIEIVRCGSFSASQAQNPAWSSSKAVLCQQQSLAESKKAPEAA